MRERMWQLWYFSGFTYIVVNSCEDKCLRVKIFFLSYKKLIGKMEMLDSNQYEI